MRIREAGHVSSIGEKINKYSILTEKSEERRQLGRPKGT
jgi:hypothetical protein